ncbi:MAG TPA: TIM barrel protein [Tepidisphaeraceae bacterium]|nr:TIM barrel protein [Tepidisphaeraceae bacterium]
MSRETLKVAVMAAALADDVRQAPRLSRGAGFGGLVFDVVTRGVNLTTLSQSGRRDFRQMLAAQDQELVALQAEIGPAGLSLGTDVDRVLTALTRVMETAAGLGTRLVCADIGPLPESPRMPKPKPTVTAEMAGRIILPTSFIAAPAPEAAPLGPKPSSVDPNFLAQVDAVLTELGQQADRFGVTLALRSELASFAALERALKAADCPWFAVDLDPVALLRDESPIDEVFSHLGAMIRHVRARDAVRGTDRRTKPTTIGHGSSDWGELLAALDAAGFQGWITIDPIELPNRTAAAADGLSYLRSARS